MEADIVGEVVIDLPIELVVVLLVHQVVVVGELIAAEGGVAGRGRGGLQRGGQQLGAQFATAIVPEQGPAGRGAIAARARRAGPAAIEHRLERHAGEVAVIHGQATAFAIAGGEQDIAVVEPLAPGKAGVPVAAGRVDIGVVGVELEPVEILAGDEVDHAGHGVGAVGGGCAILQDLDATDGGHRDEVQVRAAALEGGRGGVGEAPPVHQHQGAG